MSLSVSAPSSTSSGRRCDALAASTGWTAYPPLSYFSPEGKDGQTLWIVGVLIVGTSSILASINYITTIVNLHYLDLAQEFGSRLVGLRDGELVFDGDIADVDDDTFMEIYGRAISDDDLVGTEDDLT